MQRSMRKEKILNKKLSTIAVLKLKYSYKNFCKKKRYNLKQRWALELPDSYKIWNKLVYNIHMYIHISNVAGICEEIG